MEKFALSSPQVVRLRAAQDHTEVEPHTHWLVSYSVESVALNDSELEMLSVIGTLHTAGSSGWGDISVGALLHIQGSVVDDDLDAALAESDAIETLYDIARSHLNPLLRTTEVDVSLPRKSPEVEVQRFSDEDASDAESDADVTKSESVSSEPTT